MDFQEALVNLRESGRKGDGYVTAEELALAEQIEANRLAILDLRQDISDHFGEIADKVEGLVGAMNGFGELIKEIRKHVMAG